MFLSLLGGGKGREGGAKVPHFAAAETETFLNALLPFVRSKFSDADYVDVHGIRGAALEEEGVV